MKKIRNTILIAVLVLSIAGCASISDTIADLTSAVTDLGEAGKQAAMMTPMIEFTVFYAAYFFLGGYGFGDDNFKEGEGVKWAVKNESSGDEVTVVRALLKNTGDGMSWWYLSADPEGTEAVYEILMDSDYNLVKIRYKNSETGQIEEITPEQAEESAEETEVMNEESYADYIRNEEKIKTKAGSFKTEHLVFEDKDIEGSSGDFKYEYWITDQVPGHCVKYRYENLSENEVIAGEIVDIRGGYKTSLASF